MMFVTVILKNNSRAVKKEDIIGGPKVTKTVSGLDPLDFQKTN